MRKTTLLLVALNVILSVRLLADDDIEIPNQPITSETIEQVPAGLGERLLPEQNPLSVEKVALGRALFFDKNLSSDGTVSCATCHQPQLGFANRDPIAIGIRGRTGTRNAPSLLNRAFAESQFWDGRAASLEAQAVLPIENPSEMGHSFDSLIPSLKQNESLVRQFTDAFDKDSSTPNKKKLVTPANIGKALAAYQRTLLLGDSPVDRFQNGDHAALTPTERTGMWIFESRGRCWKCHSGRNFTDEKFHNTGVSFGSKNRDTGRYQFSKKDEDRFKFKTPTLRGVELTAPYMHDGSVKTLEDVVRFYSKGGSPKDQRLDDDLETLDLSEKEISQLVAFLKALSRSGDPEATKAE